MALRFAREEEDTVAARVKVLELPRQRKPRWTSLPTAPLAVAFLPLAVVLYVDAELSARLPLTSNEMDGGSLLMRCAFGACIPFFLLFAVGANVVGGARRLVRRPPPSD